jgi:hypothetical protein
VTNGETATSTSTRSLPRRSNDAKEKDRASHKHHGNKKDDKSDDSDADDDKERHLRRKLMPVEADDFKIVFISSDSSKESDQVSVLFSKLNVDRCGGY